MYFSLLKYFVAKRPQTTYTKGEGIDDTYWENSPYIFLETLHFFGNLTFFSIKNINSAQKSINYDEIK